MTLQGKTALVTGGGRDIGRSVSIALARAGARVAINYNSGREAAEETLAAIKDAGGDAFLIQADVTDSGAVAAMLDEVGIAFSGRLDILVNLAGGMVARKTLGEMDEAFFDHVMTLNL
jgi:3-oxoacyl-[acyl-carrier protein] reductase